MELAKGVRDFSPVEMQLRNSVIASIKEQFVLFGFESLETPIIERLDTLTAKMGGSDDTDVSKEIFKVEDQGGRELGLRFDLTVPLARYAAMHKDLKLPFRRYEIGRVYRDGPIKLGRYREFIQCDADIIGAKHMLADAECISLAAAVFDSLGIPVVIRVNNRSILDAVCTKAGIKNAIDVMISIDKLEKIGEVGVRKELSEKGIPADKQDMLFSLLLIEGTNAGKIALFEKELGAEAVADIKAVLDTLRVDVEFAPSLARGLAYYTGTVFEAFALESAIKSSLMGGGRYDKLISLLQGSKEDTPAVGVSFGIEPICEVLKERKNVPENSTTQVFVVPIGETITQCLEILDTLRKNNISCTMDISKRNITKNIEYASKLRIPYLLIVGEKDLAEKYVTCKNLESGEEKRIPLEDIALITFEF